MPAFGRFTKRALGACALALLAALTPTSALLDATPNSVTLSGKTLLVDGTKFPVRGVAYSPVPVGEDVNFAPYGDYFTPDYAYLWSRDLKEMKAAGFNTLRIYSWKVSVNHLPFLDHCSRVGMKVIITHYIGAQADNPVQTDDQIQSTVDSFANHVKMYGDHPAILMWVAGNELNGAWMGYKSAFDAIGSCGWTTSTGNCDADTSAQCQTAANCLYPLLFGYLNRIVKGGTAYTTRPITTAFADVDFLVDADQTIDKLHRFDSLMPDIPLYMVQLYRGRSFGTYFDTFGADTSKPLMVGEYGVDAYNDPCGWPENFDTMRPCYGGPNDGIAGSGGAKAVDGFVGCTGSGADCARPGETAQSDWDSNLTTEIEASSSVIGGVLVSWQDENWKGIGTQDYCETPCSFDNLSQCQDPSNALYSTFAMGGSAGCTYKAHITCSNYDTKTHDLCGYFLASAPDRYVNEEWFGMNGATDCGVGDVNGGHRLSALAPRPVVSAVASVFGASSPPTTADSCDALTTCWQCTQDQTATAVATGACDSQCGLQFTGATYSADGSTDTPPLTAGDADDAAAASTTSATFFVMITTALIGLLFQRE